MVFMRAGSDPTSRSVRAKAEIAPAGAVPEVDVLLGLGAEDDQGLWDADRLVGGEKGGEIAAVGAESHGGTGIVGLREPESGVAVGNLDSERPQFGEASQDGI
jgi:hypothetical protein